MKNHYNLKPFLCQKPFKKDIGKYLDQVGNIQLY